MKLRSLTMAMMLAVTSIGMTSVLGCDRAVEKYDKLSSTDEECNAAWANIEAQMQRRSDLIPNLVTIVKASATHEEKVLKEVIEARASATQIKLSGDDFSDPEKLKKFNEAQAQLKGSLSKLLAVQENYPDLKANSQFHDLMVQVEGTENRILQARREYNDKVKEFNFELRRVSGKVINPLTHNEFKPRIYFQADSAASVAPKVSL